MKLRNSAATRRAPAKINLRLEIRGRRADDYHEIRSIMCPVGLCDLVTVTRAEAGITITANTNDVPLDAQNLAYRAADLFMEQAGLSEGIAIHLEKNIPVGAGLGGGSSDAAAVLFLLDELTGAGYSQAVMMELGGRLGSDVPFFFCGGPAVATGRGERLSNVVLSPPFWVVLIMPQIFVSTAWAYNQYRPSARDAAVPLGEKVDLLDAGPQILANDLEEAVIGRYQELGFIKDALHRSGAWGALMSGSGSAVYGIFFEAEEALKAKQRLQSDYLDRRWRVAAAPALL